MTVYRKEAAFLTPSLIVFYVYILILTVVVSFLAPLFATKTVHEVSNSTGTHVKVMQNQKGFLHKLEEETCLIVPPRDTCIDGQKNVTSLEYPSTIIVVQMSVCCPFVLVTVLCIYWEGRRCRNVQTKAITIAVICIKFESLHILGYIVFPVFIGPDIGFTWNDLEFGYFIGIGNIVFVCIWLIIKLYTTKRIHLRRKYKSRLRKSDPVYKVDNFIFVEQHQKKWTPIVSTITTGEHISVPENNGQLNSNSVDILTRAEGEINGTHFLEENQKESNMDGFKTTEDITNKNKPISALECGVKPDPQEAAASFTTREAAVRNKEQRKHVPQLTELARANEAIELVQQNVIEERRLANTRLEVTVNVQQNIQTLENECVDSICITSLIEELWSPQLVGIGRDSNVPRHSRINIKMIQHICNDFVWNHYKEKKKELKTLATDNFGGKLYCPEEYGTDIKAVKTDEALSQVVENSLSNKTDKNINEHYLFHGTDICNIPSISQNGFDKSACYRTMLGKGVYFTDHPVKADQYTGSRGIDGDRRISCMILARVLLGNSVITKVRNSDLISAASPPCKVCLSVVCSHDSSNKFDSLIFDGGLFREYVVYENFMAYPEYVIYYDRVSN